MYWLLIWTPSAFKNKINIISIIIIYIFSLDQAPVLLCKGD